MANRSNDRSTGAPATGTKEPADPGPDGGTVHRRKGPKFGINDPAVVRDETIHRNVKSIYNYLVTFCGAERSGFPGRARMARETGLSLSALDVAKKTGAEIRLWTIEQRPLHLDDPACPNCRHLTSNRYWLHDFGDGYVPGSGNGRRAKGKPRGRATASSTSAEPPAGPDHPQNLGEGPAADPSQNLAGAPSQNLGDPLPNFGQEQYQRTGPRSEEENPSGEDAAGATAAERRTPARPRANTPAPAKLRTPNDLHTKPIKAFRGWLVGATATALKAAGHDLSPAARQHLGQQLYAGGRSRAERARMVDLLQAALADPAVLAWNLDRGAVVIPRAEPQPSREPRPAASDPETVSPAIAQDARPRAEEQPAGPHHARRGAPAPPSVLARIERAAAARAATAPPPEPALEPIDLDAMRREIAEIDRRRALAAQPAVDGALALDPIGQYEADPRSLR